MARSRLLKLLLQLALVLVLGYFLLPGLIDSIREFDLSQWHINYLLLVASLLLMQVVLYCQSAIWSLIIRCFDKQVSFNKAFRIAYLAQLGRYIPGKVWQLFGMIYLASKEGIKKEEATLSFILSQLFITPPGLLIVFFYLFAISPAPQYQRYIEFGWIALLIVAGFLVVFLWPGLFKSFINRIIKLIRQPQVEFQLQKALGLRVLLAYFVTWNLYGLAFYLFIKALLPEVDLPLFEVVGAWTLAYLIGYWTVVLPAGIGAREAVLLLLLTPIFQTQGTPELAGVAVIGARAWSILGEIICTLLAWRVK